MRKVLIGTGIAVLFAATLLLGGCRGAYVGSSMSHRYHDPDCMWAKELPRDRQVWFATIDEAVAADYEPCSTCTPDVVTE